MTKTTMTSNNNQTAFCEEYSGYGGPRLSPSDEMRLRALPDDSPVIIGLGFEHEVSGFVAGQLDEPYHWLVISAARARVVFSVK
jgi:hypothetical protein